MDEVANSTDMPRERMLHNGAQALADYELLAILLRTGSKGSNVLEFSRELLRARGGLVGLFNSRAADLQAVRGLGKAKTAEILAVTELARRFMREEMRQPSWSFKTAADVRDYLLMQFKGQALEAFDRSIDVHVGKIRQAIETDPRQPVRLLTVRGVGYVLARARKA